MKTALLASSEKNEPLVRLAKGLTEAHWSLLGSAGTAKYLSENNIPCRDVGEIVGAPVLGHRVVTLSRELHAALLSRTEDEAELEKLGFPRIDLVYVTLYPLEQTIADGGSPEEVIEKTDIGGPTLLRSAAKGGRLALSSPDQIDDVLSFISGGEPEAEREKLVRRLRAQAERRVSEYTATSASYWEKILE